MQYWQAYKARFVTNTGRVVDTANDLISHSEGQGYAPAAAVAANDRPDLRSYLTWTRANLMVRDDQLAGLALVAHSIVPACPT